MVDTAHNVQTTNETVTWCILHCRRWRYWLQLSAVSLPTGPSQLIPAHLIWLSCCNRQINQPETNISSNCFRQIDPKMLLKQTLPVYVSKLWISVVNLSWLWQTLAGLKLLMAIKSSLLFSSAKCAYKNIRTHGDLLANDIKMCAEICLGDDPFILSIKEQLVHNYASHL